MAIKDITKIEKHLFLCNGGSCKLGGAEESTAVLRRALAENGLSEKVHTTKTLCNGRCKDGPIVICMPDGIWFQKIDAGYAPNFVKEFLEGGTVPQEKILYQYGQRDLHTTGLTTRMCDRTTILPHRGIDGLL